MKRLFAVSGIIFLVQVLTAQSLIPFNCGSKKWGYVNKNNYLVINCQYTYAGLFKNGYAEVANNGDWGIIDSTGKEVIPLKYESIKSFYKGTLIYEDVVSNRYGITSVDGKVSLPLGKAKYLSAFYDGFAVIELSDKKRGMINYLGDLIIPVKYDGLWQFVENMAMLKLDNKYGFADRKGKVIVPVKYESASDYHEGLASVTLKGKSGYVDMKGKVVIPLTWEFAGNFSEGLAPVKSNGLYGFIDKTGKIVVECKYQGIDRYLEGFKNGRAVVQVNDKFGCIDYTGKDVIPPVYESFSRFSDSLALVVKDGKKFFLGVDGEVKINPDYDEIDSFNEGLARVKKNDKYGLIATDGKEVLPVQFNTIREPEDGLRYVEMTRYPNDILGYVDVAGKPFYYSIEELEKIEEERRENFRKTQIDTEDMAKYLCYGYTNYILGRGDEKDTYQNSATANDVFRIIKINNNLVQLDINIKAYKGGIQSMQNLYEFLLKCPMNLSYGLISESGFKSENKELKSIILTSATPEGSDNIFKTIKGCFLPWENRLYLQGYVRTEQKDEYFEIIANVDPAKPFNSADNPLLDIMLQYQKILEGK